MEQDRPLVDFSWMANEGISMEEFGAECLEQLLASGVDTPPGGADQRAVCRRYLQQLALKISVRRMHLPECEPLLKESTVGLGPGDAKTLVDMCWHRTMINKLLTRALQGLPVIYDWDYKASVSVSSSRVSSLQQPLLSLAISTTHLKTDQQTPGTAIFAAQQQGDQASQDGTIYTELTLDQLDQLLAKLKNAQAKMAKFEKQA